MKDDFPHVILQDVLIQPSGQLCVNVTLPFPTEVNEMGVMYYEARDPSTGDVQYHVSFAHCLPADMELRLTHVYANDN